MVAAGMRTQNGKRMRLAALTTVTCAALCAAGPGAGSGASLFRQSGSQGPLIALQQDGGTGAPRSPGSLFSGAEGASLFAPWPDRPHSRGLLLRAGADPQAAALRHLIALAEAGPLGYDAVQHGARAAPPARPTEMTLAQIYAWIERTPGQPHAIGRYQFIPATLRRLAKRLALAPETVFSPGVQDRLADLLLAEAGLADFREGRIARHQFMLGLAKIWAGLPTAEGTSYYHGVAGNRATLTWTRFEAEMARIFPG